MLPSEHYEQCFAGLWKWLHHQVRERRTQLRLCLRMAVAAVASFSVAQFLDVPLAGLWAVLTSVVVSQMSLPERRC
jgi:uncharacterized membrane protein YccC